MQLLGQDTLNCVRWAQNVKTYIEINLAWVQIFPFIHTTRIWL